MNTLALGVLVLAVALGNSNADFSWDFCSEEEPCIAGQGDCDRDAECQGTAVCGRNNCNADFGADVSSYMDCCRENRPFDWNWCTNNLCGEGEGDCDSDDHCEGDLVCGEDNCFGDSKKDCCEQPESNSLNCGPGGCANNNGFGGFLNVTIKP